MIRVPKTHPFKVYNSCKGGRREQQEDNYPQNALELGRQARLYS